MFWSDKLVKSIIDSGTHLPLWVDDMFTPSGFAHIGSLRGPIVHDVVYRSLLDAGKSAQSTYIFNDFDPIDGLPEELKDFSEYLGFPLRLAPSPQKGYASFAEYFTHDFKNVLTSLGIRAQYLSSWDMYHQGLFDQVIREALDSAEKIQDIYHDVSGSKKREHGWLPLQVICEKCQKLGTTRVHKWDGKLITYTCEPNMVAWAKGCGHSGIMSPFGGNAKLPWKVDWPAHWKVIGVTIEGAGKDHSSAGGSRDIAKALCLEVFHYPNPFNIPYEFFLIGGKKMSSSKGLGLKARDLTRLLPPVVARFLFVRTDYRQAIEFDPLESMAIPDLFDEYDRSWKAYIDGKDEQLSRVFILSQIHEIPPKNKIFIPRFRDIANYIQLPNVDIASRFEEVIKRKLKPIELEILNERVVYAKHWIQIYAPLEFKQHITTSLPNQAQHLKAKQKEYLKQVRNLIMKSTSPDDLQCQLYALAKEMKLPVKEAFAGIYLIFLGRPYGPKAAWFLMQYPKVQVIDRIDQALKSIKKDIISSIDHIPVDRSSTYLKIDSVLGRKFPTMSVGVACIEGVRNALESIDLEKEKRELMSKYHGLTTEKINQFPEVLAYRKIYRQTGIDWHSRRPSPEALLRRLALGKELYKVNTLVDAYNLVVMKHRVSVGAFDLDQIQLPAVVRFAKKGEKILLLGDQKETEYKDGEVAYFDQNGGYNIDFNYRDSQKTKVTVDTKNIFINVDGVYDITPNMVIRSLAESIEIILKYCGGKVTYKALILP